jgi:4-amino-4-deoxy-L-arabinose transferase-like glycosyltransferase
MNFSLLENRYFIYLFIGCFLLISLLIRPIMPIDETRYLAVAWEMWSRQDFWVPYLNGEPYSHKPPLFFWLMHLGWAIFGVNDWTPRLIAPVFSLLSLWLVGRFAQLLWADLQLKRTVQWILGGFYFWMISSSLTMFDVILSFFILWGIFNLYCAAAQGLNKRRWVLLMLSVGLGILCKGPVTLLHLAFLILLMPFWKPEAGQSFSHLSWFGFTVSALFAGVALALCWALPAAYLGGEEYRQAILWGQTGGRVVDSFAHRLPWWWYFQWLPLLLLPWWLWKPCWKGCGLLKKPDAGIRFCLFWILPVLIAFCLVSGKRLHYLLPLFPAVALLLARLASHGLQTGVNMGKAHMPFVVVFAVIAGAGLLIAVFLANSDGPAWMDFIVPVWVAVLFGVCLVLSFKRPTSLTQAAGLLSLVTMTSAIMLAGSYFESAGESYNVKPIGEFIADLQKQGDQVVYDGNKYHGEYNFAGRLTETIQTVGHLEDWTLEHPAHILITTFKKKLPDVKGELIFRHPYRGGEVAVFRHHEN